ncbi:MAG: hypothetical protein HYT12_03150 [Candidatus Liptonbacteria bacterium]|nr:hypothetical protein [Candidatus Liptonbacteria bacterium]
MNNKSLSWFVVMVVVLVGGFVFYQNSNAPADAPNVTPPVEPPLSPVSVNKTWVVSFDGTAFTPRELTVKKGDTVTWENDGTQDTWPATAMHPTHTVYPGSDIEKCGTSNESKMFDACRAVKPGESYSFTFNEVGEWGYHNHLLASVFGKVTVAE